MSSLTDLNATNSWAQDLILPPIDLESDEPLLESDLHLLMARVTLHGLTNSMTVL